MKRLLPILACAVMLLAAPPRSQQMRVRIPVWTDSAQPLHQEDIVATVDGEPARVLQLHAPSDDLMLLVVLDLVGDLNEIDLARDALRTTIPELPVNTHLGLLRAQDGLQVLLDPTTDRDAALNVIENFPVSGTPGLLETVETVSALADSILAKAPVRIAVCFITDSNIYEYREDFTNPVINYSDSRDLSRRFPEGLVRDRISKLEDNLASRQAPIFIVHVEHQNDRLNEAYQNGLMELAAATGGSSVFCRSNTEIGTAVEQTLRTASSHYGLDLQVAGKQGSQVEIVIESETGPLNYRNKYRVKKR